MERSPNEVRLTRTKYCGDPNFIYLQNLPTILVLGGVLILPSLIKRYISQNIRSMGKLSNMKIWVKWCFSKNVCL